MPKRSLPRSGFGGLLGLTTRTFIPDKEASFRSLVNTFLLRVSAMIGTSGEYQMVIETEDYVPKFRVIDSMMLSGFIDYSVLLVKREDVGRNWGALRERSTHFGFLSVEAKQGELDAFMPQSLGEMLASGRRFGEKNVRGVLTNGTQWMFLLTRLDSDGRSRCLVSDAISLGPEPEYPERDLIDIVGILFHWIQKGFKDFDQTDWMFLLQRFSDDDGGSRSSYLPDLPVVLLESYFTEYRTTGEIGSGIRV